MSLKLVSTRLFSVLCLCMFSLHAQANQWYHVEVVVFEQLNTITDEKWPETIEQEATPLLPNMATSLIQPANNETLISATQRLDRSSRYRVHFHQAWQQPILRKRSAQAVAINAKNQLVAGNIRLYKSTYLHAELDLWLLQNIGTINSSSNASLDDIEISVPRNPRLIESRRIRSKKLYYFDHPTLGALLQLTPIETPAEIEVGLKSLETYSLPTEAAATLSE